MIDNNLNKLIELNESLNEKIFKLIEIFKRCKSFSEKIIHNYKMKSKITTNLSRKLRLKYILLMMIY